MSTPDADAVRSAVEDRRDDLIDLLADLVAAESVTGDERPAQEVVIDRLESAGLEPDVWEPDAEALRGHPGFFETSSYQDDGYEDRPNVAATVEGSGDGRSLVLSGHVDVVDVEEEEWTYEPWEATVEGDRIYGRGAADMKGGVAALLIARDVLSDLDVDLAGDLTVQTTIEEEAGGVGGVLSALERGYQPDAALITEPFGVPNIGIASAGVMYFRVTVHGRSAHAARGHKGVNAIGKAAEIYRALEELDRERKARISYEPAVRMDPEMEGNVTNLNVGTIEAGDWPSTVPAEAVLECRIGWPPGESRAEVREEVEGAVAAAVEADEWLSEHPPELEWFGWSADPHELDPDEQIVRIATERAEAVTGGSTEYIGGSAGLDERFYNRYYDIPCPTVGPTGDNLHGADEWVDVDSLVDTVRIVALTAMDWCGTVD